jgi:hypothetical protein
LGGPFLIGLPAVFPIVIYNGDPAWAARRDVAELIQPLPGGLTAYRPTLRYHLLDEGRVQSLAANNTVADLIEIESAPGREQMQTIVERLSKRLAGPQNTELRRALAVWIRRVIAQRLPPQAKLPPVTELSEVQAMLSRNVTRWDVRARQEGRLEGRQEGRQEGRLEGRQEGRQEGLLEGRIELARSTLERLLTRRFGPLPSLALDRIHQATLPQLET